MLPRLPFLETMITQACNLSCLGCTNYSDLPHSGYVSWSQGRKSLERWLTRVRIDDFGIMGGEPLLNPEWKQWLMGVRELLPQAQIRFTTNGVLLHRWPNILDFLQGIGKHHATANKHATKQSYQQRQPMCKPHISHPRQRPRAADQHRQTNHRA